MYVKQEVPVAEQTPQPLSRVQQLIKNNNDTIATTAANKAKSDAQTAHMRANEKKAQSMAFKKKAAAAASDSGSDSDDE